MTATPDKAMDQKPDLRVQPDSQHDLEELFRVAVGQVRPDGGNSTPLRMRNLPPSFFTPPDPGSKSASHSRESSLDQQSPSPLSPAAVPSPPAMAMNTGARHVAHLRAHSSPATLPSSLSVAAGPMMAQPITSHHVRQLSYDVDKLKLPEHWEMAVDEGTGKRYFMDHKNRTTTWDDPRIRILQEQLQQQQQQQLQFLQKQQQQRNTTAATTSLPALPEGWEQKHAPDGEIYFINHLDRTTTWDDPRIPAHMHKRSSMQTSATAVSRPPPPPIGPLSTTLTGISCLNGSADFGKPNLRVQMLLQEKERYRQRSQEILYGVPSLSEESVAPGTVTGMDAFLGNSDCHSRQESSDSGLGLGSFSLPRTPEGVLSSESDDRSSAVMTPHTSVSEDLGLDSLNITSMDLGNENMDSDDLMSTLPVLAEDLQLPDLEDFLRNNKNSVWL